MIANIIKTLQSNDFYGSGEYTELAKGKNEYVTTWKGLVNKCKRIWHSRKQ